MKLFSVGSLVEVILLLRIESGSHDYLCLETAVCSIALMMFGQTSGTVVSAQNSITWNIFRRTAGVCTVNSSSNTADKPLPEIIGHICVKRMS